MANRRVQIEGPSAYLCRLPSLAVSCCQDCQHSHSSAAVFIPLFNVLQFHCGLEEENVFSLAGEQSSSTTQRHVGSTMQEEANDPPSLSAVKRSPLGSHLRQFRERQLR